MQKLIFALVAVLLLLPVQEAQAAFPTQCGQLYFFPTQPRVHGTETIGLHWIFLANQYMQVWADNPTATPNTLSADVKNPRTNFVTTRASNFGRAPTYGYSFDFPLWNVASGWGWIDVQVFFESKVHVLDPVTIEIKEMGCAVDKLYRVYIKPNSAVRPTPVPGTTPTPAIQCSYPTCAGDVPSNAVDLDQQIVIDVPFVIP